MTNRLENGTPEVETGSSSMRERFSAMLERGASAFGNSWNARRILRELEHVLDPAVSEVEGGRRAEAVAAWYADADAQQRRECWRLMSEHFTPDVSAIEAAHEAYEAARGTEDEARAEIRLRRAFTAPRTRLLRRFSAYPGGVRFLVALRAELLPLLRQDKRLLALDSELRELFSTWFDYGFLELRRISWNSPASLVEKLIRYEAVHDIRGWADAKNRLDEDRRCYGFFHPSLPGEPLIFVEVALLGEMADSMPPLLDESAAPADLDKATTAVFYSISTTQPGLKRVSFGDALIKRVALALQEEFPRLKVFVTLSPIPGLRHWLGQRADALLQDVPARAREELAAELHLTPGELTARTVLQALDHAPELSDKSPLRRWLLGAAARYLVGELTDNGRPLDPVARFHLGNGARVERLNWMADPSAKGHRQSWGLMVNYLYDLKRIDRNKAQLAQGKIPSSRELQNLSG